MKKTIENEKEMEWVLRRGLRSHPVRGIIVKNKVPFALEEGLEEVICLRKGGDGLNRGAEAAA